MPRACELLPAKNESDPKIVGPLSFLTGGQSAAPLYFCVNCRLSNSVSSWVPLSREK